MKKIVAFGASNSLNSINKQLASFTAYQIQKTNLELLDLNDYEMPIFSIERARQNGIPEKAKKFKQYIKKVNGIIISFAENNGSYSSSFKNIFDWISRVESKKNIWEQKPMFLLATAPGARGGQTVLELATKTFPFQGAKVIASFSLPFFQKNFSVENGIIDPELRKIFEQECKKFQQEIS